MAENSGKEPELYIIVGQHRIPKTFHIERGGVDKKTFIPYSKKNGHLCFTDDLSVCLLNMDEKDGADLVINPSDIKDVFLDKDNNICIKSLDDFGYKISNGGDVACIRALYHILYNKHVDAPFVYVQTDDWTSKSNNWRSQADN